MSGDAAKLAKAGGCGVRIFTIGVGTPEGRHPITGEVATLPLSKIEGTGVNRSWMKTTARRAEATGGFYLHWENGPRTMKQLIEQGISKMQAGEIDVRLSRRPIERYEWPLGAAIVALAASLLINDRKKQRRAALRARPRETAAMAASILMFASVSANASAPGLDLYQQENLARLTRNFRKTLQRHPQTRAADKILRFRGGRLQDEGLQKGAGVFQPGAAFKRFRFAKQQSLQSGQHALSAR